MVTKLGSSDSFSKAASTFGQFEQPWDVNNSITPTGTDLRSSSAQEELFIAKAAAIKAAPMIQGLIDLMIHPAWLARARNSTPS
ncbi:hypothetical protein [Rhizobium alvei]|uniref:Uncharacterized protein n=1 Tax=Rhizobium alvei TaxID=1132659 RepID=A0ABT8YM66_9HYPH|nr:hypothetical protein [Rhizobium alvei]MDO6964772.1 hypothetical protein [Rhizobium alvei]